MLHSIVLLSPRRVSRKSVELLSSHYRWTVVLGVFYDGTPPPPPRSSFFFFLFFWSSPPPTITILVALSVSKPWPHLAPYLPEGKKCQFHISLCFFLSYYITIGIVHRYTCVAIEVQVVFGTGLVHRRLTEELNWRAKNVKHHWLGKKIKQMQTSGPTTRLSR